jgi:amino acid transporter
LTEESRLFTYILYGLAAAGLVVSFLKDKKKTKAALMKAWKAFENILPQTLVIFLILGFALAIFSPETIRKLIGEEERLSWSRWSLRGSASVLR